MNTHQIFKLIFNHDQRLNELDSNSTSDSDSLSALADFMKPDPTYSRLYFTATDLKAETYGINSLSEYSEFIKALEKGLNAVEYSVQNNSFNNLESAVAAISFGEVVILNKKEQIDISALHHSNDNFTVYLKNALEQDCIAIYKEEAPNGFNLHLFSKKNIYPDLFYALQNLLPDAFRFFSINGKKFRTQRHFYFETWTLDKPPHGFEEVFVETVL